MVLLFIKGQTVLLLILSGILAIYALICDFLSERTRKKVEESCELNRVLGEVKSMTDEELLLRKKVFWRVNSIPFAFMRKILFAFAKR